MKKIILIATLLFASSTMAALYCTNDGQTSRCQGLNDVLTSTKVCFTGNPNNVIGASCDGSYGFDGEVYGDNAVLIKTSWDRDAQSRMVKRCGK